MSTAIADWRARVGLNQKQAAEALGYSTKGYQELERGCEFGTGKPVEPNIRTRLACAAIERKLKPI